MSSLLTLADSSFVWNATRNTLAVIGAIVVVYFLYLLVLAVPEIARYLKLSSK